MKKIILILMMAIMLNGIAYAMSTGSTIIRSVPATAITSSTMQLSYSTNETGLWGASVTDTISGGCTIDGKTSLKFVMMSYLPNPLTYTVTAPASATTCTLSGDYKFAEFAINNFPQATITITGGTCTPNCACASNTCAGQTCSNGCNGTCAGTKVCGFDFNAFWTQYKWYIIGIGGFILIIMLFKKK